MCSIGTVGSNTASRDNSFSLNRAMVFSKAEQNKKPKVGVLDSSQRTALQISSFSNLRTQYATMNKNDVNSAIRRTRNYGYIVPPKVGAVRN